VRLARGDRRCLGLGAFEGCPIAVRTEGTWGNSMRRYPKDKVKALATLRLGHRSTRLTLVYSTASLFVALTIFVLYDLHRCR
jgi:hypothetical protein